MDLLKKDLCDSYMVARPFQSEEDLLVHRSVLFPSGVAFCR